MVIEHELLLFAAFWFIVSALDEAAIDFTWLWLRLTGKVSEPALSLEDETQALGGRAAVFVPAWHEADVIGAMISHTLRSWPQDALTLYVGCYCNDPDTIAAAMKGAAGDARVRLVIHGREGPTTKADCLNRLYAALCQDEERSSFRFKSVILHDAEDMVHPAALSVIDRSLSEVQFVQLPVRPEPQAESRWISGHYADEFAEAHAKSMVVRDALGAAIPAAGVGCGFSRDLLGTLACERSRGTGEGPFAADCLTEDYELGLLVSRGGAKKKFLRLRDHLGALVATRAFFPGRIEDSVKQKARWIHGIALQGWDRLGWSGGVIDSWMALRDRRGPLTAIVLTCAYGLLVIEAILAVARLSGWQEPIVFSPVLRTMLTVSFAAFIWRTLWRFGFTASEYGLMEGMMAVLRVPVANVISIMAGRRAVVSYVKSLRGAKITWDKTAHSAHPADLAGTATTG
ncbi:MAG: glycosyl transferase family protein [Sphingomonadaceae bacterium]|nr:glycosyl transferase family protein [Sphingomonadaceae bacterium]